jgi:hypothetical protein
VVSALRSATLGVTPELELRFPRQDDLFKAASLAINRQLHWLRVLGYKFATAPRIGFRRQIGVKPRGASIKGPNRPRATHDAERPALHTKPNPPNRRMRTHTYGGEGGDVTVLPIPIANGRTHKITDTVVPHRLGRFHC